MSIKITDPSMILDPSEKKSANVKSILSKRASALGILAPKDEKA